jgi:hypothetical protein
LGQPAAILTEKSRENSAKSLSNVSCHERGKKYLAWQNASNAEPSPGKDEPHLPARGKPILVNAIYFADGTLATALSPIGPRSRWPEDLSGDTASDASMVRRLIARAAKIRKTRPELPQPLSNRAQR